MEGPVAEGSYEAEGNLQIPPQTVELILREVTAGDDLKAVAGKYGIPVDTITAWQATRGGRLPTGDRSESTADAGVRSRPTGRYSKEFKEEVLAQVATGRMKTEIAKQYGIPEANLYRWIRQAKANGGVVPDAKSTKPSQQENLDYQYQYSLPLFHLIH